MAGAPPPGQDPLSHAEALAEGIQAVSAGRADQPDFRRQGLRESGLKTLWVALIVAVLCSVVNVVASYTIFDYLHTRAAHADTHFVTTDHTAEVVCELAHEAGVYTPYCSTTGQPVNPNQ